MTRILRLTVALAFAVPAASGAAVLQAAPGAGFQGFEIPAFFQAGELRLSYAALEPVAQLNLADPMGNLAVFHMPEASDRWLQAEVKFIPAHLREEEEASIVVRRITPDNAAGAAAFLERALPKEGLTAEQAEVARLVRGRLVELGGQRRLDALFDGSRRGPDYEGLFGPDSMMWRIMGHGMGYFGGLPALATQASLPPVAESALVTRKLAEKPHPRLAKTSVLFNRLMFGSRRSALAAARRINDTHAQIDAEMERTGFRMKESVGKFPAGTAFRVRDPELLKWVLATLYFHTLSSYERFVGKVSDEEKDAYFREFMYMGRLLAIPPSALPRNRTELEAYYAGMLKGDSLAVGGAARQLAAGFLKEPKLPWPITRVLKLPVDAALRLAIGQLPARVRELHGLPWGLLDRLMLPAQEAAVRAAVRITPEILLRTPALHAANLRVRAGRLGLLF